MTDNFFFDSIVVVEFCLESQIPPFDCTHKIFYKIFLANFLTNPSNIRFTVPESLFRRRPLLLSATLL
jgi:hypothetical protein